MADAFSSLLGLIACPAKLALSVAKLVRPAVEMTELDISVSLADWFAAVECSDASAACLAGVVVAAAAAAAASSLTVVAWLT